MSKRFLGMLSCLFASLLALYLFCFSKSSGMMANALSDGKFLTPVESLAMFGEQITGRYFDGTGYTDIIFYYDSVKTFGGVNSSDPTPDILHSGNSCLLYTAAHVSVNTNPQYITFDFHPEFSLLDTSQIHTAICLNGAGTAQSGGLSNSVYSPPRWEWVINGINTVYQTSGSGTGKLANSWPVAFMSGDNVTLYSYVVADYTSNSSISGYSLRASFYGNSASGTSSYKLLIACPYVSSNAFGQTGTLPVVITSPVPSYTVIVDNAGVESRLDDVVSAVDDLGNIIQDDGDYDYGSPDEVIENAPSGVDEEAIEDAMSKADTILDDIPSIVVTGAFWMNCAKDLVNDDDFIIIVPLCILLSFVIYIWWKK